VSVLIRPAASSLVVAANAQAPTTPTGLLPGTIIDIAYRGRLPRPPYDHVVDCGHTTLTSV